MKPEERYLQIVADELKISPLDIKSKSRKREFCEGRQITSYLLLKHTKMSLYQVAWFLNYVSHASPWRDKTQVENLIMYNKQFALKTEPILLKARELKNKMKKENSQNTLDQYMFQQPESEWYKDVFYSESLMII